MKAPVFRGVGRPLAIETLPDPVAGPGELILKIGRCGICGSDLHSTLENDWTLPEGTVLGHEFAGEVVDIGRGVAGYSVGDRVAALGVHTCGQCGSCLSGDPVWCHRRGLTPVGGAAQYAVVQAHASMRLPDSLSLADGALVEPLACALHSVRLVGQIAGARVLVLGAGPLGLATAFWANRLGARRIAVATRSSRNEHLVSVLGATHFLLTREIKERLLAVLGAPPDIVFECVGAPTVVAQAIDLVRPRGTVVIAGGCPVSDVFRPLPILIKEVRLQGSYGFDLYEFETVADTLDRGASELRKMITHTVSLEEFPAAFEALRRPTVQCKVMIDPWA